MCCLACFTWLAYPAWLATLPSRPVTLAPFSGRVAIIVVARDEAARIGPRLSQLRALEAPFETEVIVVDDGSSDGTGDLAQAVAASWPALRVLRQPPLGKAAGLALGASASAADVLVFADVRQALPAAALVQLLEPFGDPSVGVVSGVVKKPALSAAGLYWRYETLVRRLESRGGSTIGATGPWYAVRRALFRAPPEGMLLDDVWIPMQAVFAGARAVVAEGAIVFDAVQGLAGERAKKARTLTGNLQLLERWPALLDPRRNPVWARYLVHKVSRLASPLALEAWWRWARRDFRWT